MAADAYVMDADLKKVADAIRTKSGTAEPLVFPDGFVKAINAIPIAPPKVETRTWTLEDFIEGGKPPLNIKYSIKPDIRQYFIVGDMIDISTETAKWVSTPIPGINATFEGIKGTITGGTELKDVMTVLGEYSGERVPFRTANGGYIPIKNP